MRIRPRRNPPAIREDKEKSAENPIPPPAQRRKETSRNHHSRGQLRRPHGPALQPPRRYGPRPSITARVIRAPMTTPAGTRRVAQRKNHACHRSLRLSAPMQKSARSSLPENRWFRQSSHSAQHRQYSCGPPLRSPAFLWKPRRFFRSRRRKFKAGSFVIRTRPRPTRKSAKDLGIKFIPRAPRRTSKRILRHPRVALVHNWQNTQNDGWFRIPWRN